MDALAGTGLSQAAVVKFFLVLTRCGMMFSAFPIFSAKQIPTQVKIVLSVTVAFLICSSLPPVAVPSSFVVLVVQLAAQAFIGLAIGLVGTFIFAGIQYAGEVIDTQVGFAVANIINPMTNTSVTLLGQFELIMATLIFLITDSHHLLIEGMAGSFHVVPLPYVNVSPQLMGHITDIFMQSVDIIFKIAVPIAVSLMITNIAMGLLARVAPQVNVFIVAFPAQLGIGMLMFAMALPILGFVLPAIFANMPYQMDQLMHSMAPAR